MEEGAEGRRRWEKESLADFVISVDPRGVQSHNAEIPYLLMAISDIEENELCKSPQLLQNL